jgi:alpha-ketoglutarate-dependent taurine dioxygenase
MLLYSSDDTQEIQKKFFESGLVCIKNSRLNPLQIAQLLGKPFKYRQEKNPQYFLDNEGYELRVSNVDGILGNDELNWHQDHSHKKGTWYGVVLRGIQNSHLSQTQFCDLEKVYEELDENLKEKIRQIEVKQSINTKYHSLHDFNARACHLSKADYRLATRVVTRRLVHTHPTRKTNMLFLSPEFARPEDQDSDVFNELVEKANNPKHHTTFTWSDNDILIIDNIKYMHRRNKFEGTRVLSRVLFQL